MKKVIGAMAILSVLLTLGVVWICCAAAERMGLVGGPDYV